MNLIGQINQMALGQQNQPQMGYAAPAQLAGWWKCIANDSKRVVGTYTFFENEQSGFYGSNLANPVTVDRRKKYAVLGRNGPNLQMRWTNENGSSGSINAMFNGSAILKNGAPWLERFNPAIQQPQTGYAAPGQLAGWWKCIANDSKRVVGTYTFFENEQTGFYGSNLASPSAVDRRKKYAVLGRNGPNLQMRWTNENGSSGSINAMFNGSAILKNGAPWLERFNPAIPAITAIALRGWWRCVGNDSKRVVNTFTYFEPTGAASVQGFYGVSQPNPTLIDRRKTYTIVSQNNGNFQIQWRNERGSSGNIKAVLSGANLLKNGEFWLQRHQPIPAQPVAAPYPVQQPGYPVQQPGYPVQHPGYPVQQPGYPVQQPGYPVQQPGYPVQQPGYPVQTGIDINGDGIPDIPAPQIFRP